MKIQLPVHSNIRQYASTITQNEYLNSVHVRVELLFNAEPPYSSSTAAHAVSPATPAVQQHIATVPSSEPTVLAQSPSRHFLVDCEGHFSGRDLSKTDGVRWKVFPLEVHIWLLVLVRDGRASRRGSKRGIVDGRCWG